MTEGPVPALLTGTEMTLVAEVPGAGGRWSQVHFNIDVARKFFRLTQDSNVAITLERISARGTVVRRMASKLVFSTTNRNSRIEFDFAPLPPYPHGAKPIVVVVEAAPRVYRYRLLMPGDEAYQPVSDLLEAGPQEGRGVRRRIVTLDELQAFWPQAALRGGL